MNHSDGEQPGQTIDIEGHGNVVGNHNVIHVQVNEARDGGTIVIHPPSAVPLNLEPISWPALKATCQKSSEHYLALLQPKYKEELYVERKLLQQHVKRFMSSTEARYLVLNGQSGMGKTGFLCRLAEDLSGRDRFACLVYDCGAFVDVADENCTLELVDCLAAGMLPRRDARALDTLLDRIEMAEDFAEECRLVIIVDAINESKHMDKIIRMLVDLQHRSRPWVKVIISCRPHVWAQITEKMTSHTIPLSYFYRPRNVNKRCVEVPGFSEGEVREAYQRYQRYYGFQPEQFDDLAPSLKERMKVPLILWLVSKICEDGEITVDVAGSDIKIIPEYTGKILQDMLLDGEDRETIKRAEHFLEGTLPKLMVVERNCRNVVSRDDIGTMPPESKNWFNKFFRSGILEQTRYGDIRFRYERFYDYYFGRHLRELANRGLILRCDEEQSQGERTN